MPSGAEHMSTWEQYSIEARIREILSGVSLRAPNHHFGHPFLTAYQIAISFAELHRPAYRAIGLPIGGREIGERESLAKYFANQLSRRIRSCEITDIEGRDLDLRHLRTLAFNFRGDSVETSTETLSMFRFTGTSRR